MNHLLLIAAGGALGAVSRHGVNQACLRWIGPEAPWGVLIVNLAGSLAVGLLVGWLAQAGRADATELRFAFGVGFLGAFTTMSALSLELILMIERKAFLEALVWGGGMLIACVLATGVGLALARSVWAS